MSVWITLPSSGGGSTNPTTINLGDPTVDGSWRIIVVDPNLSFQRRESGVWVEKGAFTP